MKLWQTFILGFLACLLTIGGVALLIKWPGSEPVELIHYNSDFETRPTATALTIKVHIVGSVVNPGVYSLPDGSRLGDAIDAAGGITNSLDVNQLNLSAILQDGQRIFIPADNSLSNIPGETRQLSGPSENLININLAGLDELMSIPGIGEAKANAILNYRSVNGFFTSLDDLIKVDGIGEAIYDQIKDLITLGN